LVDFSGVQLYPGLSFGFLGSILGLFSIFYGFLGLRALLSILPLLLEGLMLFYLFPLFNYTSGLLGIGERADFLIFD